MFALLVEQHLFQKAVEYVDGTIDLQELEEWLLPNLETILDCGNDDSIALAELIEGRAIELQIGISSSEILRQKLRELLHSIELNQNIIWSNHTAESKKVWDMGALDQTHTLKWHLQFA